MLVEGADVAVQVSLRFRQMNPSLKTQSARVQRKVSGKSLYASVVDHCRSMDRSRSNTKAVARVSRAANHVDELTFSRGRILCGWDRGGSADHAHDLT